jgi:serine/threonine protein kinase
MTSARCQKVDNDALFGAPPTSTRIAQQGIIERVRNSPAVVARYGRNYFRRSFTGNVPESDDDEEYPMTDEEDGTDSNNAQEVVAKKSTAAWTKGRCLETLLKNNQASNTDFYERFPQPNPRILLGLNATTELQQKEDNVCSLDKFHVGERLGKGSFGSVYKVRTRGTEKLVFALKKQGLKNSNWDENHTKRKKKGYSQEINVMRKLRGCEHTVDLYGWFRDPARLFLVMEFVPGGNFEQLLRDKTSLDDKTLASYIEQLTKALIYCHANSIWHRDVKPENMLLDHGKKKLKLGDFGIAVYTPKKHERNTMCGSIAYSPPEMIRRMEEDESAYHNSRFDNWSLGVCIFQFVDGAKTPFEKDDEFFQKKKEI